MRIWGDIPRIVAIFLAPKVGRHLWGQGRPISIPLPCGEDRHIVRGIPATKNCQKVTQLAREALRIRIANTHLGVIRKFEEELAGRSEIASYLEAPVSPFILICAEYLTFGRSRCR